jgi:hypothetical protein
MAKVGLNTLGNPNPLQVDVSTFHPPPITAVFNSSAANRSIQLSVDGNTFFTPAYDSNTSAQLVVAISAPISAIQFTGASGDQWGIL